MWKATASWPVAPCQGPTGIAYDRASDRIFSGCNNTSVVVDPNTGKVVATIKNGTRVDALGWDPGKKLVFIPNGGEGNVTVVHQDSPDKYTTVATVDTFAGAKTIAVDPATHNAYLFQPERGPAPAPPADAPPAGRGRGRGPQGPIVAAWFMSPLRVARLVFLIEISQRIRNTWLYSSCQGTMMLFNTVLPF